jgi:hypothetical protein
MFIRVDFPDPEGPMMDSSSREAISKEMPRRASMAIFPVA